MLEIILPLAIAVVGVLFAVLLMSSATTVYEYEHGLRFVRGRLRDEVGPGRYFNLGASTTIRKVDLRPTLLPVNSQEVLSRDGVAVKASLTATYRVTSVRTALVEVADYRAALYTELQQALRVAVSGSDVEALLANRAEIGPQILRDVQPRAARLGLEVETLAIRDLTLPGELKKMFAQVVKARQEGLAALERARGETAALRHLANAAQMVERNPQLLQLRLLQVAGQQSSMTMVVGIPPGTTPLPIADSGPVAEKRLPPESPDTGE